MGKQGLRTSLAAKGCELTINGVLQTGRAGSWSTYGMFEQ